MAKSRRERDKPKAGPDAFYDPNKRVKLSYESGESGEDEDTQQLEGTANAVATDTPVGNTESADYPDDKEVEGSSDLHITQHEDKEGEDVEPPKETKLEVGEDAPRKNNISLWSRETQKNDFTGQWPALGSLSYQWEDGEDDEEYDSTEEEAMEYLAAVRSERQKLPTFFKASNGDVDREIYENGVGDTRGYYEDDAYIGRSSTPSIPVEVRDATVNPQAAYTITLRDRYMKQRHQLHLHPDPDALAALGDKHPISFPANNNKAYAEWHRSIRGTAPQPAQICALEPDTVFRLLQLIQKHFLQRGKELTTCTSVWIWSLFARLDEVGNMNNDLVSLVREFGKKAVLVQLSFSDPVAAKQLEEASALENEIETSRAHKTTASNAGGDHTIDNQRDLQTKAKHASPSSGTDSKAVNTEDNAARQNTLATLDAIILIVGDVFGQRDLLEFRHSWKSASVRRTGV